MPKRFFLELSYLGTNYSGWQIQPNGPSVQEDIQKALQILLHHPIKLLGAGRTDAGVHAKQMFAHFDTETEFNPEALIHSLNGMLSKSIAILDCFEVMPDVSARFDALSRTYQYHLVQQKNPFKQDRAYFYRPDLDFEIMNQAGQMLTSYKDFACFCKAGAQNKTNLCDLSYAQWSLQEDQWIFTISANRFLRNMVRAIVGTMIEIGRGAFSLEQLQEIVESKERSEAGFSAPAHGLYLTKIAYPKGIRK